MLLETIHGQLVAAPAAWTPLGAAAFIGGDTPIVRAFRDPYKAWCIGLWARMQTGGGVRLRSTDWHDNVSGFTVGLPTALIAPPQQLFPHYQRQPLRSQTTINFDMLGTAVALDVDSMAVTNFYENTGDLSARLIDEPTLDRLSVRGQLMSCQAAIVGGVLGGYSGATGLGAFAIGGGQWRANKDYALVGYQVVTTANGICSICIRGADTGQCRIGMPGDPTDKNHSANYFVELSRLSGLPTIPVFNAANIGNIIVDMVNDENALTPIVTLYFILLDSIVAMQS
jgi:hypothetical protein